MYLRHSRSLLVLEVHSPCQSQLGNSFKGCVLDEDGVLQFLNISILDRVNN